jgi:hypothetical protein
MPKRHVQCPKILICKGTVACLHGRCTACVRVQYGQTYGKTLPVFALSLYKITASYSKPVPRLDFTSATSTALI